MPALVFTLLIQYLRKTNDQKEIGFGALITHALGGVAEPGMISLLLTNGQLMGIQIISAFLGSLYLA